MIKDIQEKILKVKQEKDICILVHSYVAHEILEVADFTGDSYALALKARNVTQQTVVMVGVRFMAETVKMLCPEKTVILAHPDAGCPMAEQMDKAYILNEKKPDETVVAYVNTTAELKTISDVCVTSSSAVDIVKKIQNKNILFIPDCNLGSFVKQNVPEKQVRLLNGGCPIHASVTESEALAAKAAHPNALLLVHPECKPEVTKHADYVGSTSGIMQFAKNSDQKEFIIGTETSIAEHLQYECPDKKFYVLSKKLLCKDMKLSTLMDVYNVVNGTEGLEITLDADTIQKGRRCIDEMIRLGG